MTNDEIIKIICKIESLNIDDYQPIYDDNNISGNQFDKRFGLDRIYHNFFTILKKE